MAMTTLRCINCGGFEDRDIDPEGCTCEGNERAPWQVARDEARAADERREQVRAAEVRMGRSKVVQSRETAAMSLRDSLAELETTRRLMINLGVSVDGLTEAREILRAEERRLFG